MQNSKFVNVNINVDGKIYKAKVQDGIMFDRLGCNREYYFKNNTIFQGEYMDDSCSWKIGKNEIKMNKSEFALFNNIANNHDEKMGLTLSKEDFDRVQNDCRHDME